MNLEFIVNLPTLDLVSTVIHSSYFCPPAHKYGAYHSMIYRLVFVPLTPQAFRVDVNVIKNITQLNGIQLNIDNIIHEKQVKIALDSTTHLARSPPPPTRHAGSNGYCCPILVKSSRPLYIRALRHIFYLPFTLPTLFVKYFGE